MKKREEEGEKEKEEEAMEKTQQGEEAIAEDQ